MKVRVGDVMTREVITIGPDEALKEAARTMSSNKVSGLPVVDGASLVGIITESDFVTRLADDDQSLISTLFRRDRPALGGRVGEVMSREPVTVNPADSVTYAARVMSNRGIKRLPVVDQNGRLVGLVSRADLMSIFARPDAAIAADVREGGVQGLVGATETVSVVVRDGVVNLTGTVGTITEKRMLEEYARQVAGVVAVESDLAARLDDTRLPPL